ncbi:MAG: AmmeMemoRadiSam system protein B [Chitinispirillaceae bacterium]
MQKPVEGKIRKPAVAGQFYPSSDQELKRMVEQFLDAERSEPLPVKFLVAPHAGYAFSGPVAAKGYALIPENIRTVFLIGPSHHQWFNGVHVSDAHYFRTPLGLVRVNQDIVKLIRDQSPCVHIPAAEESEHSIEVQLPFLQTKLNDFSIVSLLTGKVDPASVADLIAPFLDDSTLVVASSDFSHFLDQEEATKTDVASLETVLAGETEGFIDGCGESAVRVVMELGKRFDLAPRLLDRRTSYETAPDLGSPIRVVGYASLVYVNESEIEEESTDLSLEEKSYLLNLARQSLQAAVYKKDFDLREEPSQRLRQEQGCFVTLTSMGKLRGCIGNIEPLKSLYRGVMDNAVNASMKDPRFPPVNAGELDHIQIEVSVLSKPRLLTFSSPEELLAKLEAGEHGVILRKGFLESTFLPQVWDQLPDKVMFLEHLALKGGMSKDDWKTAEVKTYRVIHFSEEK